MDEGTEPRRRRGTVLLLTTIIVIATVTGLNALPPTYTEPNLAVKVGIIDSGINIEQELETRVVAERSFVNTTYGYSEDDNLTTDSSPRGVPHGTYVARIIAAEAPDAALVNAKVVAGTDIATPQAIVEAIHWLVLEENCSVINLSLGISPIYEDLVGDAVKWAFNRGVSIVAAAGNNGQDGIAGSSVESPAVYPEVIAVAAVDETNSPYSFSAVGPLRDRIMKPDISARGDFNENGLTVLGTSFAAPIVSAGAAKIIAHCIANNWKWTPGMIKAAIMIGAFELSSEEWRVGAGLFDLERTLLYVDFVQKRSGLPLIAVMTPTESPYSFERYFVNHTARIHVSVFSSGNDTFSIDYQGNAAKWLSGPSSIFVNQTGSFYIDLRVESTDQLHDLEATVTVDSSRYWETKLELAFSARIALREVAFDISHTPWAIDSSYGQFRCLYRSLTKSAIAVDELRDPANLTIETLSKYDAVFVLDPCGWATSVDGFTFEKLGLFTYTAQELNAYLTYFNNGGNLFLVGLSNSSIDQYSANALFSMFNITLNNDRIPVITITINGIDSTGLITDLAPHPITEHIDSFDYSGCSLNFTGDVYEIAKTKINWRDENGTVHSVNRTVLVGLENLKGGRLIATGSNFFIDNWALNDLYRSDENLRFTMDCVYWLVHVI